MTTGVQCVWLGSAVMPRPIKAWTCHVSICSARSSHWYVTGSSSCTPWRHNWSWLLRQHLCAHYQMHQCPETEFALCNAQSLPQTRSQQVFSHFVNLVWGMSYCLSDYGTLILQLRNRVGCEVEHFQEQLRIKTSRMLQKQKNFLTKDGPKTTKPMTFLTYWLKLTRKGPEMSKCAPNWPIYPNLPKTRFKIGVSIPQIRDQHSKGFHILCSWSGKYPTVYLTTEHWY